MILKEACTRLTCHSIYGRPSKRTKYCFSLYKNLFSEKINKVLQI